MEELRLSAVATRVVAWHNTHPLARRITAAQVHAIGYVALPFSNPNGVAAAAPPADNPATELPEGGTLRERAQARARQQQARGAPDGVPTVTQLAVNPQQLAADFSENFIDPLTPREVERYARRHGQALVRAPADGPVRQVRADGGKAGGGGLTLYLLTAVIETGTRKSRVLLGGGNTPAVLGRRVLAPARMVAALLPLLAAGVAALLVARPVVHAPLVAVAPAASAPALAASAVAPVWVAAASAAALAPDAVASAASAPAEAAAPEPVASAPLDVEPRLGRIDMPSIRPQLGRKAKPAQPGAEPALAAPPAATPPPPVAAFALSTRPLRTRAEADQVRVAMKSLLKAVNATEVRVDVLPEGDDWRVVGMPFVSRAEADKARALLVSRGMRIEVVGF